MAQVLGVNHFSTTPPLSSFWWKGTKFSTLQWKTSPSSQDNENIRVESLENEYRILVNFQTIILRTVGFYVKIRQSSI